LVSLSLNPDTVDSDFIQVKYKGQANEKDYSHKGIGFYFKKWQSSNSVQPDRTNVLGRVWQN